MGYVYHICTILEYDVGRELAAVYRRKTHDPSLVVRSVDAPVLLVPLSFDYVPHLVLGPIVHPAGYVFLINDLQGIYYLAGSR